MKQHLRSLLPICARMNGTRLLGLYRMCVTNSPVMFQSLNNQLALANSEKKERLIEIDEHLQFLEDLKPFVPASVEEKETIAARSFICVLL